MSDKDIVIVSTSDSLDEMKAALGAEAGKIAQDKDPNVLPELTETGGDATPPTPEGSGEGTPPPTPATPETPPTPPESGEGEDTGESGTPTPKEPAQPPTTPKKKSGSFQERISEINREKKDAEVRADAAEREVEASKREIDALKLAVTGRPPEVTPPTPETPPATPPPPAAAEPPATFDKPKPEENSFSSQFEYQEVLTDWKIEKNSFNLEAKYQKDLAAQEKRHQDEEAARQLESAKAKEREDWKSAEVGVRAKYADYDEVIKSKLMVSDLVSKIVASSDNTPELVYYLAKNPEEAARLSVLSNPTTVAMELGVGVRTLKPSAPSGEEPPPKTPSTPPGTPPAPPPLAPVGTQPTRTTYDIDNMSQAEYNKLRDEGKL